MDRGHLQQTARGARRSRAVAHLSRSSTASSAWNLSSSASRSRRSTRAAYPCWWSARALPRPPSPRVPQPRPPVRPPAVAVSSLSDAGLRGDCSTLGLSESFVHAAAIGGQAVATIAGVARSSRQGPALRDRATSSGSAAGLQTIQARPDRPVPPGRGPPGIVAAVRRPP